MKLLKLVVRILVLLLVLVGGVFLFRTYETTKAVNQYRQEVAQIAAEKGVGKYSDVILGIMYTESKGKGVDLMQSSESVYGERGKILTQRESIEKGVAHFAESRQKAVAANCDLSTAIQAYNFGFDYISFVKDNGGKSTIELAERYSRDVLSPKMGNPQKAQYRYIQWQSLSYNGGYLYRDGGNMFYADIVKMNIELLNFFQRIQK